MKFGVIFCAKFCLKIYYQHKTFILKYLKDVQGVKISVVSIFKVQLLLISQTKLAIGKLAKNNVKYFTNSITVSFFFFAFSTYHLIKASQKPSSNSL